jgi:pimeloyl-ACP methyl ester carboxylesterase
MYMFERGDGKDWMDLLFGTEIQIALSPTWQLVHELKLEGGNLSQWLIKAKQPLRLTWSLQVFTPPQSTHSPRILLSPDGCWPQCIHPNAMKICAEQGVSLAWLNRLDFAHDPPSALRQGPFYDQFPMADTGCLSVWAWGVSQTAHVLRALAPDAKIGVFGHSRGGKAALLCAARDRQIDAVISNNSGTGGAASFAVSRPGAESLHQLASVYPHWLSNEASDPDAQRKLREIDCMAAWASIAPRPVLILQSNEDVWANPAGTKFAFSALKAHWPGTSSLRLVERAGLHAMQASDWQEAAKFMRCKHAGWF